MGTTTIEWADRVWNLVTGCTPVSEGCRHCYAARMSKRLRGRFGYPADDPFRVTLHPDRLEEPLHWKKPARIFVDSMGDLFHPDVPFEFIDQVFDVMNTYGTGQHKFLILTKQHRRMNEYISSFGKYERGWFGRPGFNHWFSTWPLPNVWLGVTAENQAMADERIPVLLKTPAAVRFVSVEPMLGPVDMCKIKWAKIPIDPKVYERLGVPAPDEIWSCNDVLVSRPGDEWNDPKIGLDWVISGGETGPGARPMHPDWVRSLRDQCQDAGVPFFFKGWGGTNKKEAGRLLDGVEWNQFPPLPTLPISKGEMERTQGKEG